jgi:hypothetical protein
MIFSIQRFVEDYLERCRLSDPDQYAVSVANLYDRSRLKKKDREFLSSLHRIRTSFFRANSTLNRAQFEKELLKRLDSRFKKKLSGNNPATFPGGVAQERNRISTKRTTITDILDAFKHAVESRAVDSFWVSRKQGKLKPQPEGNAQSLLAVFVKGVIGNDGLVFRELLSGTGFVDVSIILSAPTHRLIELKILKGVLTGASQLETYMKQEQRRRGSLVLIDTRAPGAKGKIPHEFVTPHGTIKTLLIDVNPVAPSRVKN